MATLYKHGPLKGIYRREGFATRFALFENGTVLKRLAPSCGWTLTAFNTQRLLAADRPLIEPDLSTAARAILTRVNAASHVHEGAKRLRRLERRK